MSSFCRYAFQKKTRILAIPWTLKSCAMKFELFKEAVLRKDLGFWYLVIGELEKKLVNG